VVDLITSFFENEKASILIEKSVIEKNAVAFWSGRAGDAVDGLLQQRGPKHLQLPAGSEQCSRQWSDACCRDAQMPGPALDLRHAAVVDDYRGWTQQAAGARAEGR